MRKWCHVDWVMMQVVSRWCSYFELRDDFQICLNVFIFDFERVFMQYQTPVMCNAKCWL